jgi:hypothetical protein
LKRQKNAAISAIRKIVNRKITKKLAVFRQFLAVSAQFLCQGSLFHFREKTALESFIGQSQEGLSGRESAPGAREKRSLRRATRIGRTGILLSLFGGLFFEGGAGQCRAEERIRLLS